MTFKPSFLFFLIVIPLSFGLGTKNLLFIIISQNNPFNDELAMSLKLSLQEQSKHLQLDKPSIYISNKSFHTSADWTITPLIAPVLDRVDENTLWVVFLEDRTNVTVKLLLDALKGYDHQKELWLGHALHDTEATIIHHFAFHEDPTIFKYPNLASGFVCSVPLLSRLRNTSEAVTKPLDFHIDPAHEFALSVYNDGRGTMLQNNDYFCSFEKENCATFPKKLKPCADLLDVSSIYFAIKTCHKFHENRVQVVKKTWLMYAQKSGFFSDLEDKAIPTIPLGVENTEQGHCQKTITILQYGLQEFTNDPKLQWLALVDDDTILSVSRMAQLTTCYKDKSRPLILGERYRFGTEGFNYPTGGAGILINRAALEILASKCFCPHVNSPDDMVIGACAEENEVNLIHIPQMHQARPADYAEGRLALKDAVTFHKHWMLDPIDIYREWFLEDDQIFSRKSTLIRSEL